MACARHRIFSQKFQKSLAIGLKLGYNNTTIYERTERAGAEPALSKYQGGLF